MIGLCPDLKCPVESKRAYFFAGVVVVRREDSGWRVLLLRCYGDWDFPKGSVVPNEAPLDAAIRETAEESSIADLAFRWGEVFCETAPYRRGKVARYYLAETTRNAITLPISPELGIPEHHEWRWASLDQAEKLLPPRMQPILDGHESSFRHEALLVSRHPIQQPRCLVVGVTGQSKS